MAKYELGFTLKGGDLLAKMLKNFPRKIRETIVDSTVSAGATVIKKAAQKNLRQNGSYVTGNLYNSMKTAKVKGCHGAYRIYPSWPKGAHAHLVEFGTGPRIATSKARKTLPGEMWTFYSKKLGGFHRVKILAPMPAKPFFRPALDENKPEVLRAMMLRMASRMAKEAEKMAREYRTLSKSYRRKLAS